MCCSRFFPACLLGWLTFGLAIGCGNGGTAAGSDGSMSGPAIDWTVRALPESVGMDSCRLEEGLAFIRAQALPVHGLLVVRDGRVIVEAYRSPSDASTVFDMQSITKSIVSGLVGVAIAEGHLPGTESPVLDLFPDTVVANPSAEKSAMTVEDLLTMRSGLAYDNDDESFDSEADSVAFILGHGMRAAPGTLWSYSSADVHLLSAMLTRRLGMSTEAYAQDRLFRPLAISPGAWLADASGITVGGFGLGLTLRDLTRIGQLYLNRGAWDGRQVIPAAWVDASVVARVDTPWTRGAMGYLWWIWGEQGFRAGGRYGQQLAVIPDQRMVIAYTAKLPLETADTILDHITTDYVLGALRSPASAPCPVSQELAPSAGVDAGVSCDNTGSQWLGDSGLHLSAGNAAIAVGDGTTSFCAVASGPGKVCVQGRAADAGSGYKNWGAALLLRLPASGDVDGGAEQAFDAKSRGIAGFQFTATGTTRLPAGLRVGVAQVDQPGLAYQNNPFLVDGGRQGLGTDGKTVVYFANTSQPSWSKLPSGTLLDASQIYALRFQVPAGAGTAFEYDVCISDVDWIDADGNVLRTGH